MENIDLLRDATFKKFEKYKKLLQVRTKNDGM